MSLRWPGSSSSLKTSSGVRPRIPRPPWGCCELYSAIHCRAVAMNSLASGNGEFLRLPFRKAWCSFKPALDQFRLGMPGQAVLPLDSQPDQYATTFRGEVDASDFLVVFAVIHIEDLGNPKALDTDSQ